MPQPAPIGASAVALAAMYAQVEQTLIAQYIAAVSSSKVTEAANIRELIRNVDAQLGALDAATRDWFRAELPSIWVTGASVSTNSLGSTFDWNQPHRAAIQDLASQSYDDLLANTTGVGAELKRQIRDGVSREITRSIVEGATTPDAGATVIADQVQTDTGIGTIEYSNGARHSLADYADTAMRTVAAKAYNSGTLTEARSNEVEFMEVFDGPSCGWESHNDSDLADGTIRTVDDCDAYDLAHPRCARSFSPRPDIRSEDEADDGRRYTPDEQADMAAQEDERAAAATPRLSVDHQTQLAARRALRDAQATRTPTQRAEGRQARQPRHP